MESDPNQILLTLHKNSEILAKVDSKEELDVFSDVLLRKLQQNKNR